MRKRLGDRRDQQARQGDLQPALPSEFGTTSNTADVPSTATTVSSTILPAGPTYVAFANPAASVTSGATAQHVTVSCTLTVGSNTQTRTATIDTDGTAGDVSTTSIPMQLAGRRGPDGQLSELDRGQRDRPGGERHVRDQRAADVEQQLEQQVLDPGGDTPPGSQG